MKFDTIIIGGGLAGLTCGIRLQRAGQKCAIISAGQSAMHFSSGTLDLLNRLPDGTEVQDPIDSINALGPEHPYSLIGAADVERYALEVPDFLLSCGIRSKGNCRRNSWRITPTGERKNTWLTLNAFSGFEGKDTPIGKKALIVNILGYLDFNTKFLADSFEKQGTTCRIESVKLEELERLRKNPSEMRATNIARVMDNLEVCKKMVDQINWMIKDEDIVVLPAVFGLKDSGVTFTISSAINAPVMYIPTMPPSVPGIRNQMSLKAEFEKAGGRFFLGDTVTDAEYDENGNVKSLGTSNFGDIRLHADSFVLASGSFFSKGLIATPEKVYEPIFGADVIYEASREGWFDRNFWNRQNYVSFGVVTDSSLNISVNGQKVHNLYAAGSVIGGYNPLYEGCGGGVAMITAMKAADMILKEKEA